MNAPNWRIGYAGYVSRLLSIVPLATQAAGGIAVGVGLYLLAGLAWTLLVGGLATVALGALREGGWL